MPTRTPDLLRTCCAATLTSILGASCVEVPTSAVVLESRYGRELGVSTRFGIVSLGALQREGRVEVTAVYGDGPATELGTIEAVSEELCRVEVPFPTPWCELSTDGPRPGETLMLSGLDAQLDVWTREVLVQPTPDAEGILIPYPRDIPALMPGTGLYRREANRFRLVGLAAGVATWRGREWLVVHGPVQLSRFVVSYRNRGHHTPRGLYRRDVRAR